MIRLTAYDQLRYMNNKDTYIYGNKTASQFLKMLAADFKLQTGEIEDTGFVIGSRIEMKLCEVYLRKAYGVLGK